MVFTCWENIGHIIAEKWAEQHPHVFDDGQHVVTAVAVDDHWLPLWLAPDGQVLQVHTFNDEYASRARIEKILHAIASRLGFRDMTVHRIPKVVQDDTKCGAYAMAFIAHVITRMPLPETQQELHTLHTNMRASFVAHLYQVLSTPKPVVWGNGPKGESGPLPRMPAGCSAASSSGQSGESGPLPKMPEGKQICKPLPERESGPLPRMPEYHIEPQSNDPPDTESEPNTEIEVTEVGASSNWCCFGKVAQEHFEVWPILSQFCTCPAALPPTDERTATRKATA